MEIKFNSDGELPLQKMIEIPTIATVARALFLENNIYYPQFVLDECPYKILKKMESKNGLKEIVIKNCAC